MLDSDVSLKSKRQYIGGSGNSYYGKFDSETNWWNEKQNISQCNKKFEK